jgi:hypothetical protein
LTNFLTKSGRSAVLASSRVPVTLEPHHHEASRLPVLLATFCFSVSLCRAEVNQVQKAAEGRLNAPTLLYRTEVIF